MSTTLSHLLHKQGLLDEDELQQIDIWAQQAWEADNLLEGLRLQRLADAYRALRELHESVH